MTKIFGTGGSRQTLESGIITDRHKQVIGVIGIGRGAGATFVAMGLALKMAEISEGVTFAEGRPPEEGANDARRLLSVDKNFAKKEGRKAGIPGTRTNIYRKVNWADYAQDMRGFPGKHIIIDSPEAIEELDLIVCAADPLPSRIMAGLETFRRVKEQTLVPVIWVLNKNNNAVSRREVEVFLRTEFSHVIPLLPGELFYRAQFDCTLPFDLPAAGEASKAFSALAEEILMHK